MPDSLPALEQQRSSLAQKIAELGDLRPGCISGTGGRCGNATCHCHQPNDPGHAPHLRLTYKRNGKSVSESFLSPAAQRKVEREIAEFREYQQLSRAFVTVNEKICQLRPVEDTLTPEEKKQQRRFRRRSARK